MINNKVFSSTSEESGSPNKVIISIVMPAYNLRDRIKESINKVCGVLNSLDYEYEIIVVDDGSIDNTYEEVINLGNKRVRVYKNFRNVGKGFAVKKGILMSRGEYVILLDADMEIKYSDIIYYIDALKHFDIVIASKWHPESVYRAPIMRKILSLAFHWMVRLLTGIDVSDTQTGLKAFRGDIARLIMRIILVKRYAFDVEILAVAKLLDLKICEKPVKVVLNKGFPIKSILYMIIDLLGIVYRLRILKWYQGNISKLDIKYKPLIPL
ncbi:MAG TPA: glycosyltransferase [Thermoprotei archaeon]|nr:glycosyltransferase [Thermoprotei archaeon]